jgi:threonine/homoserine/homoserine lactone efflux protein
MTGSLCELLAKLVTIITELGAIIGVLYLIYSGFRFIAAQGNKDEIKKAKASLINALFGVVILLGATVIVQIIIGTISSVLGGPTGSCPL